MPEKKKLIEVALPLEAINAESSREKSIRHGHPSTLHLWWARRPLAAARAVIWSSLVDDPSSHPEEFPTEEAQTAERERLFGILERLVKWENSNNQEVLAEAKAEIMKSTDGNPPALLDPFAGGGSIPLEAQRLGLKAYASDLNPVAVMINKAMIEIPPRFAGQSPVNPISRSLVRKWAGTEGLAEDVRYYGEWMKQEAFKRIGHLYPKVKDEYGQEHTVIAWIWARTVKCPNPACGCEMPLASSFQLTSKKGKEAFVQPIIEGSSIHYEVKYGKNAPEAPKTARGAKFKCIRCGEATTEVYIRTEANAQRLGQVMIGIIAESRNGRVYLSPSQEQLSATQVELPDSYPRDGIAYNPRDFRPPYYGLKTYGELFTNRQLTTLSTLQDLLTDTKAEIKSDAYYSRNRDAEAYSDSVIVYLGFLVDKMTDYHSSLCTWHYSKELIRNTFGRQAVGITWDYSEANPFSNSAGCIENMIDWIVKSINNFPHSEVAGKAEQRDAQSDNGMRNIMVSTDPPYYNNIAYADLSDYFYVWLRRSLKSIYPDLFRTMLVPKAEELVANPYRFEGGTGEAQKFFEEGMLNTFMQINTYAQEDIPVSVYYAYKQSDSDENNNTASTGWETMLTAIIRAGFSITGTWPMRTEMANRSIGIDANALASSIVLVCRKRPVNAKICTRRDFFNSLKRELKPALMKLQASNIAPVDLAQSAIGPGMGVYSSFSRVLEADGTPMSVRTALQIINQELDLYFSEQDGELDRESRFCVDLYMQYAFNEIKFGDADVLARAKNTSVEKLAGCGVLYAHKGVVRLLTREEIPETIYGREKFIWLFTQQLTRALEKDGVLGVAKIITDVFTSEPEQAKSLAYRLFTIAERKGWAQEAYAYNSLVIAWQDIQSKAADLQSQRKGGKQATMFEVQNH